MIVHYTDIYSSHVPNVIERQHCTTTGIKRCTLFNENNEPTHYIIWLPCFAITQANALIPHEQLWPTAAHFLPHPDRPRCSRAEAFSLAFSHKDGWRRGQGSRTLFTPGDLDSDSHWRSYFTLTNNNEWVWLHLHSSLIALRWITEQKNCRHRIFEYQYRDTDQYAQN